LLDKLTKAANKSIPRKVSRYLLIIPRLQCLYMEPKNARRVRWHKEGTRANLHVMVHPTDVEAWKNFSLVFPEFALEPRNVRVAVTTYGFNPFVFGALYSC
jgi:hypothetical protein